MSRLTLNFGKSRVRLLKAGRASAMPHPVNQASHMCLGGTSAKRNLVPITDTKPGRR